MTAARRVGLVLAATAALSLATTVHARDARSGTVLALGFAVFLALQVGAVLARPRGTGAHTPHGPLALAGALAIALLDRHAVVSSRTIAPDDLATALAIAACVAVAISRPRRAFTGHLAGLGLTAYAVICAVLIAATPYHSDAVANVHRAAEHLLSGADPYRTVDTLESLDRFGLDRALATHLEDGSPLRSFNYPALSFLVPAIPVALGLSDLRVLYLAIIVGSTLAATAVVGERWRLLVVATVVGNAPLTRQHVLAGVDPVWAVLLGASLVALANRRLALSACCLGLAAATRQPAWFAVPLVVASVWRDGGPGAALRYGGIAAAGFATPQLPFLLAAPEAILSGVLAPIVLPLEPHGVGLVRLAGDAGLAVLPRAAHAALALAALAAALAAALLRRPAAPALAVLGLAPLYLAWRALASYFASAGVFAALAIALEDDRAAPRPERHRAQSP